MCRLIWAVQKGPPFKLFVATNVIKNRSNFGEVDVAPAPLPYPHPIPTIKVMFISGRRNSYRNFIESICIFSYDAWEVGLEKSPQSVHFHKIWGKKMTNLKWKKVTKINLKNVSDPRALQTRVKTCAKFQKDRFKIVWEVAITRYPLSIHLRSENDKVQ